MMNHIFLEMSVLLIVINLSIYSNIYAQKQPPYAIKGKIYNGQTIESAVSAIMIIKEIGKAGTVRQDGSYQMIVPKAGGYIVKIQTQVL
jgi:hypothetical protein